MNHTRIENHLFTLARSGRRLTQIIVALVLALVFVVLGQIVGGGLALLLGVVGDIAAPDPLRSAVAMVALLVLAFAPIAALVWLWVRFFERRALWTLGLERAGAAAKYGRGVLVGLALYSAALGVCGALGYLSYEPGDPQTQGLAALGGVLLVYLGWTVQGPVEELLCRGWLMPTIGARYRPWVGVLVSSLFFTFLHSLNPNLSVLAVLNLFLFGLFAALYALWDGSLWGVGALHAAWNWAQGNLFGIAVSGNPVGGGILLNLRAVGPDVVTGGAFGSEGGLAVTAVLLVGCIAVGALLRRGAASRQADATSATQP